MKMCYVKVSRNRKSPRHLWKIQSISALAAEEIHHENVVSLINVVVKGEVIRTSQHDVTKTKPDCTRQMQIRYQTMKSLYPSSRK